MSIMEILLMNGSIKAEFPSRSHSPGKLEQELVRMTTCVSHSFLNLPYRAVCVDPFCTSGDLLFSQSNSQPRVPLLCSAPFREDTIFYRTQGSHFLDLISGSCSENRRTPADKEHKASAMTLQVLKCWQEEISYL